MKQTNHKTNMYTEKSWMKCSVTVHCMTPDHFKDFNDWKKGIHVEPKIGVIKYHDFTFGKSEKYLAHYGCKVLDSELRNYTAYGRTYILNVDSTLLIITSPGLLEQKQYEMF